MTISTRATPAGGDNTTENQSPPNPNQPTMNPPQQPQAPATSQQAPPAQPSQQSITPPGPQAIQHEEGGGGDSGGELLGDEDPDFPNQELAKLDEMINRPRWVVPVLPKGELEVLLEASIKLCKKNLDTRSEACQRFLREGLTISFTKILTDEAVSSWKYDIHKCIMQNAERLVELCVVKLSQDWFPLLDLLAMVLNPNCKFHCYNGARSSETVPSGTQLPEDELYARPPDPRTPRGWLVDLVNRFGKLNGFQTLLDRFMNGTSLNVPVIAALIRPFGLCCEVLTTHVIQKYFMPIVELVPKFLDGLTDDELKKESKTEAKNDALSGIIKALKSLASRISGQEETVKALEVFRLKMILRLLQISSFNGKMNALNEINKMIANVSYLSHRHGQLEEEEEWLNAEKMAEWIQQNQVLSIVLRDSLHQPQYVEKLEKILRFMIKEKALTQQDLDKIWEAQAGKHEAIVKNVHDLLTKLAWDFSPEQLDHLFSCFQESWTNATKKQREKLLELIRRLAEDDKEGVMANKVLGLLWNLAHSEDVPTEIMDQALNAHLRILDYSCSQDRDAQKMQWINRFLDELKNDQWVLPALKQIREICQLFSEAPQNFPNSQRTPHMYYRNQVISDLQTNHLIVVLVAENLSTYMEKARAFAKENPDVDPTSILPDGRFNHVQQVNERLKFLRFLLKDGQLWLCQQQAKQIWTCLAENAIYPQDREACFRWFTKLMGEEPDLDPLITREFFESNILQFDPCLLSENGMNCFERFFKAVNSKDGKILAKRRGGYMMDDLELIGLEYLWRVVLYSPDEVSEKATQLMKDVHTNLGPRLQSQQVEIHEDFLQDCMERLKASYDTVSVLQQERDSADLQQEAQRMVRVLTVIKEYIAECDDAYGEERVILPLGRACRGKHVTLLVRFPNQGRQTEDIDVWSHTNDTVGSVRRQILHRVKANNSNIKVDLYVNGELLEQGEDKRLISHIPVRDKTLITAKLVQVGGNMPSSPDSSSDSSTGSPHGYDGPNIEAENCLPGVIMANRSPHAAFLFQLADLGCTLNNQKLVECARALLRLMPADVHTVKQLRKICLENAKKADQTIVPALEAMYFGLPPAQVLYNLEVTYSLLMPAHNPLSEEAYEFQHNFLKSGGVSLALNMLNKNNFMPSADVHTKRAAYLYALKTCKLLMTAVAHAQVQVVADACQTESQVPHRVHNHAVMLQQALHHTPNPNAECMTRNVAMRLGNHLSKQITGVMPDLNVVKCVQKIAWCSSCGNLNLVHSSNDEIHLTHQSASQTDAEDVSVCREALELLTVCLALCPTALEALNKDKAWQTFIIDLLLLSKNRSVRMGASEQFLLMATKCCAGHRPLVFFITLLFTVLSTTVKENAKQSHEYFQLLHRLLNFAFASQATLGTADVLLNNEITWLKRVRDDVIATSEVQVEEALLEGHLGVTRELLAFQPPEKKYHIGSEKGGANLIKELVEDFIFPASKIMLQCQKDNELPSDQATPVCSTPLTITAGLDLLVALCSGCVQNLLTMAAMLMDMFYSGHDAPLVEWEYLPPIGPRPHKGFVGLKNAGATCYMNSVLQQLFMIDPIRTGVMSVEGAADDLEDDDADEKAENEANMESEDERRDPEKAVVSKQDERKDYNMGVLKQVQSIFGHLACSRLQYYVPKGFWKHFKLWGEPVNLREQHDALEFFNSLVDSLDEALKVLGQPPILSSVLAGSFADQKICKDCPHRYSREEPFTTLNVDIRHHQNLLDSLEQYVKGDLLEGANAYHCDKCNKKVDTVKRMCIKKLPKILAIQLKRFDYDWERECAIKFNDYFEFNREFDMEPYTVQGLAKIEGQVIAEDGDETDIKMEPVCTKYRLVGVVVHSGQASGGHYYSYILHRTGGQAPKWYKFDDGEVLECKMEDDEEMKNQCFGGEYMGEVFDHMLKRMSYRRQKRWWNAYILFYERLDEGNLDKQLSKSMQDLTITKRTEQLKMPPAIEKSVRKQNIQFMHNKNQFSMEYFQYMRKLLTCNAHYITPAQGQDKLSPEAEEIAMISTQLASKFLFNVAFRTKKTLRGPASEWYDALSIHLRHSKNVRYWFAQNVLFAHQHRFAEYLLESPSSEVRNAFMKIIVFLAHFCHQDGPCPPGMVPASHGMDSNATMSDHLLVAVLSLLNREVAEHGRHLSQYFHLFLMYANLGVPEKQQLLKLNVPAMFMLVALDEGPGPPIKYQHAELGKLYSVVSLLVRCCDVSSRCQSSVTGQAVMANPHGDHALGQPLMMVQSQVADILFGRPGYIKKVIEDCNTNEDTVKLLRFCCWENPHFSSCVLNELLWQVAYSYTYELRPHLDLLFQMLMLDDSWQNHRIHNALKGIPEDRDGLFDTIQRSKTHHQKRAYQCIKTMVNLFRHCPAARQMLDSNGDMKRKWTWAVEWLNEELERRPYGGNTQYGYNSWSPPAQSNETSNGYFLERSQSAKWTLRMAYELLPEEEPEEGEGEEDPEGMSPQHSNQQGRYPQQNNQVSPNPPSYSQVIAQPGGQGQSSQVSPTRPTSVQQGPQPCPGTPKSSQKVASQKNKQPETGEEEEEKTSESGHTPTEGEKQSPETSKPSPEEVKVGQVSKDV